HGYRFAAARRLLTELAQEKGIASGASIEEAPVVFPLQGVDDVLQLCGKGIDTRERRLDDFLLVHTPHGEALCRSGIEGERRLFKVGVKPVLKGDGLHRERAALARNADPETVVQVLSVDVEQAATGGRAPGEDPIGHPQKKLHEVSIVNV